MESTKLIRAVTGTTCILLFSKGLAMVRSILQAHLFGVGGAVDAFTLASNDSVSLFTTLCYGLCVGAVPLFSQRLLEDRDKCCRTANRLLSNTLVLALALSGLLMVLVAVGAADGLLADSAHTALFRVCFLCLVPTLPVIALTYLLLALFQAMGHYALQGKLSLLYNLVLCGVLVLLGDRLSLGAFAAVTSAAWLLQLATLLPSARREDYRFRFSLNLRERAYWSFLRRGMMTVYNSSLFVLCYLINLHFAAAAGAEGTAASFFYAENLYLPLATTLIYGVSIVLFPQFSQEYARLGEKAYRQTVAGMLGNLLLLVLPLALLLWAFGTPVVRVLFEGGGFSRDHAVRCGGIVSLYALGLPGFFLLDLLNKAHYAMGKLRPPLVTTTLALTLCLGSNLLVSRLFPDQPQLLALGTSLGFLAAGWGAYVWFARQGGVPLPKRALLRGLLLALGLGVAARRGYDWALADGASKLGLVAGCLALGGAALGLYLVGMGPRVPAREILKKLRRKEL